MLLGARQFFAARKAAPLPYDAEVEYLENDGLTQYIITDFVPDIGTRVQIKITTLQSQRDRWIIGLSGASGGFSYAFYPVYQYNALRWGGGYGNYVSGTSVITLDETIVLESKFTQTQQIISIDGEEKQLITKASNFARGNNPLPIFAHGSAISSTGNYNPNLSFRCRVGFVKFWQDESLVRDFQPVRFTNELGQFEGAMYDRVSGQLFRNQGTGAFTIGPDKTSWTNPYVTDGLVAMWDGEWNAGWGTHDANATSWKELVSGTDCAIVGNLSTDYSWSGKSLLRNTESRGYFLYDATVRLQDAFRAATFTIEATTSQPVNNANWQAQIINICQTSQTGGYSQGIIARWRRENNGTMGSLSGSTYPSGAGLTLTTTDALATFACTYNAGQYVSYLDGEQKSTGSVTPDSTIAGVWVRSGSISYAFRGHYHSIRVYSRALTAAEIAANYAIDKARFNLP